MTAKSKKSLMVVIGIIISGYLIWWLFHKIDFAELLNILKTANYWWLLPNIILIMFAMYQRAYRWYFMLEPIKKVKFQTLLAATCVGFMANNVLPARLGEFVRAYSLSAQDKDISKSASLATIFVERMVFDLVALLLIFGGVLSFSESLRTQLETNLEFGHQLIIGAKLAIVVAVLGILIMLFFAKKPHVASKVINVILFNRYMKFWPEKIKDKLANMITSMFERFSYGLQFLTSLKAVLNVGFQTLLIWVVMGLSNYFVFLTFGFDITIDASFVLLVVVSILIMVPSTPGFVGVYHYGVVVSLGIYAIPDVEARACAIVLHAAQYLVVTLMGFYFLKKEHLSLKKLEESAEEDMLDSAALDN